MDRRDKPENDEKEETPESIVRPNYAGEKPTGLPSQYAGGSETARQAGGMSAMWDEGAPTAPVRPYPRRRLRRGKPKA